MLLVSAITILSPQPVRSRTLTDEVVVDLHQLREVEDL